MRESLRDGWDGSVRTRSSCGRFCVPLVSTYEKMLLRLVCLVCNLLNRRKVLAAATTISSSTIGRRFHPLSSFLHILPLLRCFGYNRQGMNGALFEKGIQTFVNDTMSLQEYFFIELRRHQNDFEMCIVAGSFVFVRFNPKFQILDWNQLRIVSQSLFHLALNTWTCSSSSSCGHGYSK